MQKEDSKKNQPLNTSTIKLTDQKLSQINQIKKMWTHKMVALTPEQSCRLDNYDKFLRFLKKELKDQKMQAIEVSGLCQALFQDFDDLVRGCYWEFRLCRTDFQSLFVKLKYAEQKKKQKTDLSEIISYQIKKQEDYLLKCKESVLLQLRNQFQDFPLVCLVKKCTQMVQSFPYSQSLPKAQHDSISSLVNQIAKNYNILPFHNFTHGFYTAASFYAFMQLEGLTLLLDDFEMFFCFLACLAHDIQHQGLNTLFQVKTCSQIATEFGKFGVMEKMHLARLLDILIKKQQTKLIFDSLTSSQRLKARKIISKAILSTDMSKHYEYQSFLTTNKVDLTLQEDKHTVVEALVHACDISNPSLEFKSYMYWGHLICIEFHDQTVKEKEWDIQVTDFLKYDSISYFFKNQSNFANTIVYPLWFSLEELFPSIRNKEISVKIKKNISTLSEALRRNSQPILLHKPLQQYLAEELDQ